MWLKLTGIDGTEFIINFALIRDIEKTQAGTAVVRGVEDSEFFVRESPEQIAAMLGAGGSNRDATYRKIVELIDGNNLADKTTLLMIVAAIRELADTQISR